jgi:hypothetical protein
MRRHAFRPAGLDTLEGRIAPSSLAPTDGKATAVYASNVDSAAVQAAYAAQANHARAMARAAVRSHNHSINWSKLGDQVTTFLGFHHHSSSTTATPATYRTANNAFRRL